MIIIPREENIEIELRVCDGCATNYKDTILTMFSNDDHTESIPCDHCGSEISRGRHLYMPKTFESINMMKELVNKRLVQIDRIIGQLGEEIAEKITKKEHFSMVAMEFREVTRVLDELDLRGNLSEENIIERLGVDE